MQRGEEKEERWWEARTAMAEVRTEVGPPPLDFASGFTTTGMDTTVATVGTIGAGSGEASVGGVDGTRCGLGTRAAAAANTEEGGEVPCTWRAGDTERMPDNVAICFGPARASGCGMYLGGL